MDVSKGFKGNSWVLHAYLMGHSRILEGCDKVSSNMSKSDILTIFLFPGLYHHIGDTLQVLFHLLIWVMDIKIHTFIDIISGQLF